MALTMRLAITETGKLERASWSTFSRDRGLREAERPGQRHCEVADSVYESGGKPKLFRRRRQFVLY